MRRELISIGIIATVVVVLFTALQQETKASILGNLGQGYDAGKEQAKRDWNDGKSSDASCPSGWTSYSWCTGYKAGYVKEWIALGESQQKYSGHVQSRDLSMVRPLREERAESQEFNYDQISVLIFLQQIGKAVDMKNEDEIVTSPQ